jgi:hypothetical protein
MRLTLLCSAALAVAGCAATTGETVPATARAAPEAETLDRLFGQYDDAMLALSPETKAYRGIRDEDYGAWDDRSDAGAIAQQELQQGTNRAMHAAYALAGLSPSDALSYRLFDAQARRSAALFPYRGLGYLFYQMNAAQSSLPAYLINIQ